MKWLVQVASELAGGGATRFRTQWYRLLSLFYMLVEELLAGAAAC
jgi:hypothetical protein